MSVDFSNLERAFIAKSDRDLYRAYQLFDLIGNEALNRLIVRLTRFCFAVGLPISSLVRMTVFDQFCGGTHLQDCTRTINSLGSYGVNTCLDYSVESKHSNEGFDNTVEELVRMVDYACSNSFVSFVVVKPTAIASEHLMEKLANKEALSAAELSDWDKVKSRLQKIADLVTDKGQRLFIDAEDSWYQRCVDDFATDLMVEYNRKSAVIFNTLQFYRWDRLEYLLKMIDKARAEGFRLGLKNVRGAYLEKERNRADAKGYLSPIQKDKNATDKDYDLALKTCIKHLDVVDFCAATHNPSSLQNLLKLMEQNNLPNNHPQIWMSQLFGMGDNLSFNLAGEGYNVCKYLPYGPVKDIIPYLTRRAEENSSIAGQMGREQTMILEEMRRRGII